METSSLEDTPAPAHPGGIGLSRRERIEAWLLTGPAGRVWSFARELGAALPLVARHWAGRIRDGRPPAG